MKFATRCLLLLVLGLERPAVAQVAVPSEQAAVSIPHLAISCFDGTKAVVCNFGGGSGGGSGGAVTAAVGAFADGAIATLGTEADAPWSGTGNATEIAIDKASDLFLASLAKALRSNDASNLNRLQTHDDGLAGVARANDTSTTSRLQTHDDTVASLVRTNDTSTSNRAQTHDDTVASVVRANDASSSNRAQTHDDTVATTHAPAGAPAAPTATQTDLLGCTFVNPLPTFTAGQQGPVDCDANGHVIVTIANNVPLGVGNAGGAVIYRQINTAGSAMPALIKNSVGQLYGYNVCNTGTSAVYLRFYSSASAPTVGSGTPVMADIAPAGGCARATTDVGWVFSLGIAMDVTATSLADNDATTITNANQVVATVFYK